MTNTPSPDVPAAIASPAARALPDPESNAEHGSIRRQPMNFGALVAGIASYIPVLGGGLLSLWLLVSPLAILTQRRWLRPALVPAAVAGIGAVGFAFSAYLNDTAVAQRHLAFAALVGLYVLGYGALTKSNATSLVKALGGICIGWIGVVTLSNPAVAGEEFDNYWKYGVATPATVLLIVFLTLTKRGRLPVAVVLFAVGIASLAMNSRSHAVVCVAAGAFILARNRKRFLPRSRLVSAMLVGLSILPIALLPSLVEDGYFGATVQNKTVQQLEGGGPLLLAGRTEPPLSLAIISEKPVFGWGDLSEVPTELVDRGLAYAESAGLADQSELLHLWLRNGEISLHSVTFTSWAEGGLMAALLPLWMIVAGAIATLRAGRALTPLTTVLAFQVGWDVLFSPMTLEMVPYWGLAGLFFAVVGSRRAAETTTPNTTASVTRSRRSVPNLRAAR